MELEVSHVQNLSSLTPIVDNIFDKYNKKFGTHKIFFQIMTIKQHQEHTPGEANQCASNPHWTSQPGTTV